MTKQTRKPAPRAKARARAAKHKPDKAAKALASVKVAMGRVVRSARQAAGLTQAAAAAAAGIHQGHLSRIETGAKSMSVGVAKALAKALGVGVEKVLA